MFTGTQKRRNFSKELALENRPFYNKNHGASMMLNSYAGLGTLKERSINRPLGYDRWDIALHSLTKTSSRSDRRLLLTSQFSIFLAWITDFFLSVPK